MEHPPIHLSSIVLLRTAQPISSSRRGVKVTTTSSPHAVFLPLSPQVKKTYSNGTYRAGAMRQISLVGAVDEEVGDYFPEFLGMLEESPFLKVSHARMKSSNYRRIENAEGYVLIAVYLFIYLYACYSHN